MANEGLRARAFKAIGKTVERVLADEQRAAKVAKAVGAVQKGREAFDKAQEDLMRAMGFASASDYKEVGKRIAALKRRVRHLAEKVEQLSPPPNG
jgi:cell fate (sporulation/competence/biofilm development) regulator YlbF (YheA/YmcA/DUF963 family)